jgi:hypothetical protein
MLVLFIFLALQFAKTVSCLWASPKFYTTLKVAGFYPNPPPFLRIQGLDSFKKKEETHRTILPLLTN